MLHACMVRGQAGQGWRLDPAEATHFAGLLVHYDAQLAACRLYVYNDAVAELARADQMKRSPLSARDAPPADSAFFSVLVTIAERSLRMNSCNLSAGFVGDDARLT